VQAPAQQTIHISHASDVSIARRAVREMARAIGFDEHGSEEIVLVVSELGSNLVKHAGGGTLTMTPVTDGGRSGMQIECVDRGPGIPDTDLAVADGFSTAGSLGYGLGTVNRMMDEFDIMSRGGPDHGTYILCRQWLRLEVPGTEPCPLDFGAAARAHPGMTLNGDAFVIRRWGESALVGVIDGLGHGQYAHRAAQKAQEYVKRHFDQPMISIFRGVGRDCRATRGVVMALARFDWGQGRLTFASVGNVEARVLGGSEPIGFMIRRGVLGLNAPNPVVTEHRWQPGYVMVLHSDGLTTHWRWEDFRHLASQPAADMARELLRALAKDSDDATVIVVKEAAS
jgi:anti-sigma regulatory factor (Ser/Thr protein kinase)